MRDLTLTIPGHPAAQGSKKAFVRGKRAVLVEMDPKLPAWRLAVAYVAGDQLPDDWAPMDGPLSVEVTFYLPRPKSPKFDEPATPADLDKLQRALGDALTQAGVIVDDARIVHWDARKKYANHTTGCVLTISAIP
ncbi:RusA family crossover junction endodeoxyribonuclease [Kocuria sp. CPCC 205300]|uniref:RusA family crossover junction endodeoxyribonuclease n=1 Tax=Kocuria sabuli TaxID=3071448 RepID=UPI0036DA84D0